MKTLIVIRHAKSSWANPGQEDRERPLNDRGKEDAPQMAKRLRRKGVDIDLFVSSPAKRARKTAKYFAEEYGVDKNDIIKAEDLYEAEVAAFEKVVAALNDQYNSVALFSHNPGITGFVNTLTPTRIDNMPTCGIFAVTAPAGTWAEFKESNKSFLSFDFPKLT